jgi:hypothetical protein
MKKSLFVLIAVTFLLVLFSPTEACAQKKIDNQSAVWAGPVTGWPRVIPARISDGENRELFVMTLGEVSTPISQGSFDPEKDQITLRDGTVISNYFRDSLGVKFYKPLSKERFPLPPSGVCTWY